MRKSTQDDKFIAEGKYFFVVDKGHAVLIDDVEFSFDKESIFRVSDDKDKLTEEQRRIMKRECPEIFYRIWHLT